MFRSLYLRLGDRYSSNITQLRRIHHLSQDLGRYICKRPYRLYLTARKTVVEVDLRVEGERYRQRVERTERLWNLSARLPCRKH